MILQDCHIHLLDAGNSGRAVLESARKRGIGRFFCNSASPADWAAVKELASSENDIVPFYGIHPWYCDEISARWEEDLEKLLADAKACIGEIGLDRSERRVDSFESQRMVFRRQLDIAAGMHKPFTIHCVKAWDALLEELRVRSPFTAPFIAHRFTGSVDVAAQLLKLGAYLSFSPSLLDENSLRSRAVFAGVPAERLLFETDYPYLPGYRSGVYPDSNEYFSALDALYRRSAVLRGVAIEEFSSRVWDNGTVFVH